MSTSVRLTVEQFDQLIDNGVFANHRKRERVELIDGKLRAMAPIGPRHENIVDLLNRWSFRNVPEQAVRVRIQHSIGLKALDSVPEPDIVWVRERDYSAGRPQPADVLLVIEVADSSLKYDRGEKCDLYAAAGIAEYWVIDVPDRAVHVYRQPEVGRYTECTAFHGSDSMSPLSFPHCRLNVASLFP